MCRPAHFPPHPDARSPAGAEIRYLIEGEAGGMIHSTVPAGQVNRAAVHATVERVLGCLTGQGQLWRGDRTGEDDIAEGRGFHRHPSRDRTPVSLRRTDPLLFLCITMPPWPGDQEATIIEGPWTPTAPAGW